MNIGFDYRLAGPGHGGLGRYTESLLEHLLLLDEENTYTVFYSSQSGSASVSWLQKKKNVKLVEANQRHYSIAEQWSFLRAIEKQKLDLMHFPNFNHPIRYKGKFVVTIHDLVHHELSGHKPTRFLHFWAYKKVMEHAVFFSEKIITPSEHSKSAVRKVYEGLPLPKGSESHPSLSEKIRVTYEAGVLRPQSDEFVQRVKEQFVLTRPYFLFVGTFERKKMVPDLAHAFDMFLDKYKMNMDLVLVGKKDAHYPEERDKVLNIKNKHRVVLTGFVSDEELAALYQGAFAYVSMSPYEGFGLPAVEALSFGLPVITVNVPVANEVYDDGAMYCAVGDLADAADKMHLLARDKQFYERQAAKSLTRSKIFSWQKCAEQTLEVYKEAYGKK